MELAEALRELDAPIVIVDDHYAEPDVSNLDGRRMGQLARTLTSNKTAHRAVKGLLGAKVLGAAQAAKRAVTPEGAALLWTAYAVDPGAHSYLDPLFQDALQERARDLQRLREIEAFCQTRTGKTPLTFSSLEKAKDALRGCAMAFVDFNLTGSTDVHDSIALHQSFAESYRATFTLSGMEWPKIVVLISSRMPNQSELVLFREATQLRAAFFNSLRKNQISQQRLEDEMKRWEASYVAAAELDRYLQHAGEAVNAAATEVRRNIDRLETHDLAMLDAFKLTAEQETLQSYVTWLIAESLASRLRRQETLQAPLLTNRISNAPLDGKMMPNSVLFEMFADVATSPAATESTISFGDVFSVTGAGSESDTDHWVVAISPACDLVRCDASYDVLCIRGQASKAASNLKSMMGFKNALFGKGSHVMRYQGKRGALKYAHVHWDHTQGLHSVKASDLIAGKTYRRIARLSDAFAQEIKELALSHASRVGIPVDPAFAIAATANVRMRLKRPVRDGEIIEHEQCLAGEDFTCAVASRAKVIDGVRTKLETMLVLTPQFVSWLHEEFLEQVRQKLGNQPLPLLDEFVTFFKAWTLPQLTSSSPKGASEFDGRVVVRYGAVPEGTCPDNRLEIYLTEQES
ncbi:hypothetical protein [Marilutibacter maris]|uniref:Uncharacterized protein n=1 Tax=Marilutibacter maris TaxID=1605891 RepID=A0A2U9T6X6_9GAMM|nr:hypothetical protein [Lysobacter maris]AWV06258.1 hypothetical protein C9I47_0535 [Lysobacter maris]